MNPEDINLRSRGLLSLTNDLIVSNEDSEPALNSASPSPLSISEEEENIQNWRETLGQKMSLRLDEEEIPVIDLENNSFQRSTIKILNQFSKNSNCKFSDFEESLKQDFSGEKAKKLENTYKAILKTNLDSFLKEHGISKKVFALALSKIQKLRPKFLIDILQEDPSDKSVKNFIALMRSHEVKFKAKSLFMRVINPLLNTTPDEYLPSPYELRNIATNLEALHIKKDAFRHSISRELDRCNQESSKNFNELANIWVKAQVQAGLDLEEDKEWQLLNDVPDSLEAFDQTDSDDLTFTDALEDFNLSQLRSNNAEHLLITLMKNQPAKISKVDIDLLLGSFLSDIDGLTSLEAYQGEHHLDMNYPFCEQKNCDAFKYLLDSFSRIDLENSQLSKEELMQSLADFISKASEQPYINTNFVELAMSKMLEIDAGATIHFSLDFLEKNGSSGISYENLLTMVSLVSTAAQKNSGVRNRFVKLLLREFRAQDQLEEVFQALPIAYALFDSVYQDLNDKTHAGKKHKQSLALRTYLSADPIDYDVLIDCLGNTYHVITENEKSGAELMTRFDTDVSILGFSFDHTIGSLLENEYSDPEDFLNVIAAQTFKQREFPGDLVAKNFLEYLSGLEASVLQSYGGRTKQFINSQKASRNN